MTDGYANFNKIAKSVLKKPNIEKSRLLSIFLEVEKEIERGIEMLLWHTTFVEDNICYFLAEIATGLIKYRKIYRGKLVHERVSVGCSTDMGAKNFQIFSTGFDLFKLSRVSRETAAPLVKRILRTLDLSPFIYENILRAFLEETEDYCATCDAAADAIVVCKTDSSAAAEKTAETLLETVAEIEENVGCAVEGRLYGVVREIEYLVKKVGRLQNTIISSYQKMVLKPAKNRARNGSEAMDLFQAGTLGLSRATSMFDVESNAGFQTFAKWWIKHHVAEESKTKSPLIKLPWSVWNAYYKIRSVEKKLESDPSQRHAFTDTDIARLLRKNVASVKKIRERIQSTKLVSLDELVRDDEGMESDTSLEATFVNQQEESAEHTAALREWIKDVLDYLDPEERRLICLRFGLIDDVGENVLDNLQIVREILRQAACKAETYLYVTGD